mmetsp:Transcript_16772/g.18777  ORF Transcript_16772/g.18777 Transcript_16772/m.18777 type:complete len:85 (+) Transcript_16772:393-647(+)
MLRHFLVGNKILKLSSVRYIQQIKNNNGHTIGYHIRKYVVQFITSELPRRATLSLQHQGRPYYERKRHGTSNKIHQHLLFLGSQ